MEWLGQFLSPGGDGGPWSFIAAIASAIAIITLSLRKRRDLNYEEMKKRITTLETDLGEARDRIEVLEERIGEKDWELVNADRNVFVLRRVLAQNGLKDPTMEATG